MSLKEFVLARVAEAEAAAVADLNITHPHPDGYWHGPFADPELAAAAQWVHRGAENARRVASSRVWPRRWRMVALRAVAALYSDHPDYKEAWKP